MDRKSRAEGEKHAAKMSAMTPEEKKKSQIKKIKQKKKTKIQEDKKQSNQAQFKTHENEVGCKKCNNESVHMCQEDDNNKKWTKRGGWPHRGGLRGGGSAGSSLNISTLTDLVRVCLCLCAYERAMLIQEVCHLRRRN